VSQLASIDFFTVPTATFRVLFVLIVLSHDRRRVAYVNVTCHPTAAWTRQQIREAFPWDQTPRYLLRDRDAIYGSDFGHRLRGFGIEEVVSAPQAPWQNPFVERVIGSIRRECLDHVIVWNEHEPSGRTWTTTTGGELTSHSTRTHRSPGRSSHQNAVP
jgi:transposase InsO family protein